MLIMNNDIKLLIGSKTDQAQGASFNLDPINPWEEECKSVTHIRNCLIFAEQMGFKTLKDQSKCVQALAESHSSKIIALQKAITVTNKALIKANEAVSKLTKEKEMVDILHLEIIERRINMVKEICSELDSILQNTHFLINRLQKPFVGNHIKMNAAHHRYANEVFMQLVPTLNDVSLHLDNITWAANNDFSAAQLDCLLVKVQSCKASVQTSYHTLSQMNHGIQSLRHNSDDQADRNVSDESLSTL
ncbi:unnamed protein product [Lymnaea stagnalis]|uniref:Uncharacterized protein n=1 Tax=Lymnaea stagnalis TaxID=6523 RepID=A0AAV2I8W8_LYMST